jgi:hypothetical protein
LAIGAKRALVAVRAQACGQGQISASYLKLFFFLIDTQGKRTYKNNISEKKIQKNSKAKLGDTFLFQDKWDKWVVTKKKRDK